MKTGSIPSVHFPQEVKMACIDKKMHKIYLTWGTHGWSLPHSSLRNTQTAHIICFSYNHLPINWLEWTSQCHLVQSPCNDQGHLFLSKSCSTTWKNYEKQNLAIYQISCWHRAKMRLQLHRHRSKPHPVHTETKGCPSTFTSKTWSSYFSRK